MTHVDNVARSVMPVATLPPMALEHLLTPFGLTLEWREHGEIAGSYWGDSEAGLIGNRLFLRPDTPVHSALHEACHFICFMARAGARVPAPSPVVSIPSAQAPAHGHLHTDAGGDDLEECAVCYLQCLLADRLPGYSRERMWADMDAWGYSFRLGAAREWFEHDADDAREWLAARGLC